MPVTKYRSVEEMPRIVARVQGDDLVERIRVLWARARLLAPPRVIERGVRRFRSIEEANAARKRETVERMRRAAATGAKPGAG